MTRVLMDIDVVLDILTDRSPFAEESAAVLAAVESRELRGLLAAHTITPLYSLLVRHMRRSRARKVVTDLLHIVQLVPVDEDRVRHALAANWPNFEDALQAASAETVDADYLVTHRKRDFRKSAVQPVTPAELRALLP